MFVCCIIITPPLELNNWPSTILDLHISQTCRHVPDFALRPSIGTFFLLFPIGNNNHARDVYNFAVPRFYGGCIERRNRCRLLAFRSLLYFPLVRICNHRSNVTIKKSITSQIHIINSFFSLSIFSLLLV